MFIDFNVPVRQVSETGGKEKQSVSKDLLEFVDSYFSWTDAYYTSVKSDVKTLDGKNIVKLSEKKHVDSPLVKTVKIITYATVLIPLAMIISKLTYRLFMNFKLEENTNQAQRSSLTNRKLIIQRTENNIKEETSTKDTEVKVQKNANNANKPLKTATPAKEVAHVATAVVKANRIETVQQTPVNNPRANVNNEKKRVKILVPAKKVAHVATAVVKAKPVIPNRIETVQQAPVNNPRANVNNENRPKNIIAPQELIRPTSPRIIEPPVQGQMNQVKYEESLKKDFEERLEKQTNIPENQWFHPRYRGRHGDDWGPMPIKYSKPKIPDGVDPVKWKRDRLEAAAKHFTGLPYKRWDDQKRGHFPARGCGLDCSNFVAWVYNFGLGIQISSAVDDLADKDEGPGRILNPGEELKKGDLILLSTNPKHVVIFLGGTTVIDSTSLRRRTGVQVSDWTKEGNERYKPYSTNPKFMFVRRIVE